MWPLTTDSSHHLSITALLLLLTAPLILSAPVEGGNDCGQGCQSLGTDSNRMSRCVRFACRRHVFRYYIRFGKRGGPSGPAGTEVDPFLLESSSSSQFNQLPRHQQQQFEHYRFQRRQLFPLHHQSNMQQELLEQRSPSVEGGIEGLLNKPRLRPVFVARLPIKDLE